MQRLLLMGWLMVFVTGMAMQSSAMRIREPRSHQVFQRNLDGKADIAFQIADIPAHLERIHIRIQHGPSTRRSISSMTLKPVQGKLQGFFQGVPTGGPYHLILEGIDPRGKIFERRQVSNLLVGDLWVLAGQSNMVGTGLLEHLEPPIPQVHCFYLREEWDIARDPLGTYREAVDPVHWDIEVKEEDVPESILSLLKENNYSIGDLQTRKYPIAPEVRNLLNRHGIDLQHLIRSWKPTRERIAAYQQSRRTGAGLGVAFGKTLHQQIHVPIGLIFCANGGTSMEQWSPALRDYGGESLYGSMLRRIQMNGGRIRGILWYQGESDTGSVDRSRQYQENMQELIEAVRNDLNEPSLPFIMVQLGRVFDRRGLDYRWWNAVQHQQLALENLEDSIVVVPAIDATMSDSIHLDAVSLRNLGRQMAKAAQVLVYGDTRLELGPRYAGAEMLGSDRNLIRLKFTGVNRRLMLSGERPDFLIHDEKGRRQMIYRVQVDPQMPDALQVELLYPLPDRATIEYGRGFNPLTGVKDAEGFSLPVFGRYWLGI